jgi:PhzF family phenazine biosynthesis protein
MNIPFYIVDAFTSKQFSGNPAAVCFLEEWLDNAVLQSIAQENNLSETAFLVSKGSQFQLRWFTPAVEVELCGHATLAAAHVLFTHLNFKKDKIVFETASGNLQVRKKNDLLIMNFPANKPTIIDLPETLDAALGIKPREVWLSRNTYMALYDSEEVILALRPDFYKLGLLVVPYIIVTARGTNYDFVSRFFAPKVGIAEDPVTGSAHCTLVPYWAKRFNKNTLEAKQLSKRGGEIFCENLNDRVQIGGRAITYAVGAIQWKM